MTDFQASAVIQGRKFAEQCSQLLTHYGYTLHGRALIANVGVEIDCVATSPAGNAIWFEFKGSVQGTRPGLLRACREYLCSALHGWRLGQSAQQQPGVRGPYEPFGDQRIAFIVDLEPAVIHQPRPGSLDDPASRKHLEGA